MQLVKIKMSCAKNVVDKRDYLEVLGTEEVVLKENTDISNPIILLNSNVLPTFNYCEIQALNRYYFVTKIVNLTNELWEVHLHVDVLTHLDLTQYAYCSRQEQNFNDYLVDSNRKFSKGYEVNEYSIPNTFFGIQESSNAWRWLLTGMEIVSESE